MLNIGKLAGVGSVDYYLSQVASGLEDYYLGNGEAPGQWTGTAAADLGLHGQVDADAVRRVLSGHAAAGKPLNGLRSSRKVPGFDLAFRAPKSVSLLWALGATTSQPRSVMPTTPQSRRRWGISRSTRGGRAGAPAAATPWKVVGSSRRRSGTVRHATAIPCCPNDRALPHSPSVTSGRIRTPDQRIRVFVSSTLGELAEERTAVRAAVEQLRLFPIMFEYGARPHPPRALYRSYLEQSDVFVGIYWQRYGWVAPDMQISGLEDEYMLSEGMPRLVYVKRPAPDIEPRLKGLLDRLRDEDTMSYKPFRDAGELRDLVLDDLALMLTERFDAVQGESAAQGSVSTNLPVPTSAFVGREAALRELRRMLVDPAVRLVSLTGPGGAGKTRLALEAAVGLGDSFADGVFFVDLSREREPEEAFSTIVRTVPLPAATDDPPLEALGKGLRDAQMLLLLDNLEQVTDAALGIAELLQHCPGLTVLVTTRESLRVRAETLFAVPPLSLPDGDAVSVEQAGRCDAVRLFVERAAALVPGFGLTDDNVRDVVSICRRLDGLPLAIELAAARVNLFDVGELRLRLAGRLDELRGGPRDLPERQRTLRRAIEWSTGFLDDQERTVFAALSVFDGARLADIEAVLGPETAVTEVDVVECLGSLVDKNLVRSSLTAEGRPRLSMLETIRGYGTELLGADPQVAEALRRAHAEHYTELARQWQGRFGPEDREEVLAAISSEHGNIRAAWSYWVDEGAIVRLDDLLDLLWGYYDAQGKYRDAVELGNDLLGVLSVQPETPERVRDEIAMEASLARSMVAVRGYTADVERSIRAAIERSGADGHAPQRFSALRALATLHMLCADFAEGAAVGRDLLEIAEQRDDPTLLSDAHLVAGVSIMGEDMDAALDHLQQSIRYFDARPSSRVQFRVGPSPGVVSHIVSGLLLWLSGFPDRAELRIRRGVELAAEIGHPYSRAYALFHASLMALWSQDMPRVAERADEVLRVAESHDYPIWRALGLVLRGTARIGSGEPHDGLAEVERGFTLYRGLSTPPVFWCALLTIRAAGCMRAGRSDDAWRYLEEAEAARWDGDPAEVELAILRGDLVLARPTPDAATAANILEQAATLAEERGIRIGHLVALTRLATLRRGTPGEPDIRVRLRALYGTFTEGFAAPQLVAARAVLEGE
jgi:predicted ATPase